MYHIACVSNKYAHFNLNVQKYLHNENCYVLCALINISTVYLCAMHTVSVRHYDHIISQRYSNGRTSKNVRRDLIWIWFSKAAWMEIGHKLPFVEKFKGHCLSKEIYVHWGCANDVGDFFERQKRDAWSVHLVCNGTEITTLNSMKNSQSTRGIICNDVEVMNRNMLFAYLINHIYYSSSYYYMSFWINVALKICKPSSKLDLPSLRKGILEERTQRNMWKIWHSLGLEPRSQAFLVPML